ncbi:MAG: FUSC family protein [Microcystis aeruginosa Ma_MB_S_20031200_S102]|uniref:FUSC family protein n=1 Tax=Microcystis aeruginosa Ma_MB_S_20031200_S102 TaxID=2486254 RepID=A0A552EQI2_MICAE|nr:MAG: FUSC family protein [Microcystis aeruginosa Ma_MB_S_20031200_S102D]TRU36703.1 MAG: FUSC family protein [Microcystis aeruginosa Ma_MB_S_20031200_S102]
MLLQRFGFLLRPSGDIEIERGIRTLLAITVPIIIGDILDRSEVGLMVGLAAQTLILADVGGLYCLRAKTLVATTIGMALALIIGTLASAWLGLTVVIVFCGLFLAGYLTVYGENGALAGVVISLLLLLAVSLPSGDMVVALQRAGIVVLGGGWTIFLALFIWPFRPNQPLRQVTAENFHGIATYLRSLPLHSRSNAHEEPYFDQIRQLLLRSRKTVTLTRRGRWGKNELRELLIVLIEDSDRINTSLIALRELLHLHPLPQLTTVSILLEDILVQVAEISEDIAGLILGRNKRPDCERLQLLLKAIEQQKNLQAKVLENAEDDYSSYVAISQLNNRLKKLFKQLKIASETAQHLRQSEEFSDKKNPWQRNFEGIEKEYGQEKAWWEPLKSNFNLESPLFRHGLRLGLGSSVGVLIYNKLGITHSFWIGLTLVIVLKPDFSLTFQRFFNRVFGTILGSFFVLALLPIIDNSIWLEVIGVISIAIALALVRFHYSLAVFFITIFALIISRLDASNDGIDLEYIRIVYTLIGSALAFILSFGFLRVNEDERFSLAAIKALEANQVYFQSVMAVYLGESSYQTASLSSYRDKARRANTAIQTALQRLIDDPSTPFPQMEPAITLSNYIPRFGRGVTVLLTELEQYRGSPPHPNLSLFTQQITQALTQLTQALQANNPPSLLPPLEDTLENILDHLQELREERLVEIGRQKEGTNLQKYLRDYNIVTTELVELSNRVGVMNTAIDRFIRS